MLATTQPGGKAESDQLNEMMAERHYLGWDPPALRRRPNVGLACKIVRCASVAAVSSQGTKARGTTELDSHANMIVIGKHCRIIAR